MSYLPGDWLSVKIDGATVTRHHFLVAPGDMALHVTMAHGGLNYQPLHEVIGDRPVRVVQRAPPGAWNTIEHRSREVRDHPYHLLRWNCESFCRYVYDGVAESKQIQRALGIGALALPLAVVALWWFWPRRD